VAPDRGDKSLADAEKMDDVLLLISGASGAGKSSVREAVTPDLGARVEAVELRHLDVVPAHPNVAWRQRMAERAVVRAMALDEQGRHLLLAGDPVAPGEVLGAPSAPCVDIAVCLLDVTEDAQRDRLRRTSSPPAGGRACGGRG
jgi:hypothetical protein